MTTYDVAVIGAGAFGCWSAWHLSRAGASVLLLDAWGPGHSRSSSGGESRIIRMGYGADEIYTRMAMRSLQQWRELFDRAGQTLFHQTGVIWMAREGEPYSVARHAVENEAAISKPPSVDFAPPPAQPPAPAQATSPPPAAPAH